MATPLVRLAPLDLIRGFVAVGRRMSVTLAAGDLCLTQSAVSRQIHSLEDALGVSLFHRGYRSITFTPAGEQLFRTADAVVRQLQDAFETLTRPAERQPVTVTASIGATALWLLPRLSELQRRYPALDVRVAANDKRLDLCSEGIDLAIRYASATNAPLGGKRLFDDTVVAVAHPSLGIASLDAQTLSQQVLIEYEGLRGPLLRWSDHLSALGLSDIKPRDTIRFNRYDQAVQAALAGQGIALGCTAFLEPLIAQRKLVALGTGQTEPSEQAYWLIQADSSARQDVRDVAKWIMEQARMAADPMEPLAPLEGAALHTSTPSAAHLGRAASMHMASSAGEPIAIS